jgi:iron complex outermembrane recepter protein
MRLSSRLLLSGSLVTTSFTGTATLSVASADLPIALEAVEVAETRAYVGKTASGLTRLAGSVKDVPLSLTTVTRQTFVDQGAVSLGDALRNVAGVAPQVGFGGLNSRYKIRGFVPPSQLVNGYRQNVFIPGTELANIEQIEVLKGPASALFGRFEPGGIVNIVTKRPTAQPFARANVTIGSHDFYRAELDVSGPLVRSETLNYRMNVAAQDNESYRDFIDYRSLFIAPVLSWQISPRTTLTLELSHHIHDGGFDRGFGGHPALLELPRERNLGEPDDHHDYRGTTARIELEHTLSPDWTLRAGLGHSDAKLEYDYFTLAFPVFRPADRTYGRSLQAGYDSQRDLTGRIELLGSARSGAIDHTLLVGVEAGDDKSDSAIDAGPSSRLNVDQPVYGAARWPRSPSYYGTGTHTSAAVYTQDQLDLAERWKLLLGARYDWVRSRSVVSVDPFNGILPGTPPADWRLTASEISPRAGLTYAITPEVSAFASWGRSFRPETYGVLADGSRPQPSEGEQLEAGLKAELLNGRLFSTVSGYRLTQTNVLVPSPVLPDRFEQSGENEINGVDFDLSAVLARGWILQVAYAYTDGEVTRDTNPSRVGLRIFNTPRHTASLWTTYTFSDGPLAGFGAGVGWQYIDRRASNAANAFFIPSYSLANGALFYTRGPWRAALNVKNLTDKMYFDSGGSFVPLYPGAPREFQLNLSYTF